MVTMEEQGPKLSDVDISALEARLGVALPLSYRQFLLVFNGGVPTPDNVDVEGLEGGAADVQVFFGVGRAIEATCIEWNTATLTERLDSWLVPIASDSGGSVFCLSVRREDHGSVLYCDLTSVFGDLGIRPPLYFVARDFEAFVAKLRPFTEDTAAKPR